MATAHRPHSILVSLVTPPGSGGIAVIEVRGRGAAGLVAEVFRPKGGRGWPDAVGGTLHYGHIVDEGAVVDEVIVRRIGSECGEVVEINCHGGIAAADALLQLAVRHGATEQAAAAGGQWPAFSCGAEFDAVQREALRLLPDAETRLAARVLADQADGALSRALRAIDLTGPGCAGELLRLQQSAAFGIALTRPRWIALVGPPNAGKSSLFNALVGDSRAIVSPVPGTTRDFVTELIEFGGYPVELVDTAGLRSRGGLVEMKGVEATWRVVSDADVIVLVIDASERRSGRGTAVRSILARGPIVAVNKSDLIASRTDCGDRLTASAFLDSCGMAGLRTPEKTGASSPDADVCEVSALTGQGLREIEKAILHRFPDPAAYPPGSAVVFTGEQSGILAQVRELCGSGSVEVARGMLAGLLGAGSSA